MKIIRNGIAIELTSAEMRQIFIELERSYLVEDIQSKAEELEVDLSDEELNTIADIAQSGLSHNDSYWESYWLTIECAIENRHNEIIL